MIKTKKQMFIMIGAFILTIILGTTTYAFFNYTRTGSANVIKTGRIYFNSEQGTAINLTNMFPIDVSNGIPNDNTKVGTVTLNVTGDTTYDEGIEYLVSAVNVQNSIGSGASAKSLPISIDVSVTNNTTNDPATTLGTSDDSYYDNRGGNSSIYKVLANETISNNGELLVGYITKGSTGVDGNIVIKAYLDKAKIAITDTYDGNETDNMGTTSEWVDGRETFTTQEWNSLQANGVSFQIKVESNEGIWVEDPRPKTATFDVGRVVNTKMKLLVEGDIYTGQDVVNNNSYYCGSIVRASNMAQIDMSDQTHILSSSTSKTPIYAWVTNGSTEWEKILNWYSEADNVYLNEDSSYMFKECGFTVDSGNFDTSNVQNMSYMFGGNEVLINDLSVIANWNVSNVTDMSYMFTGALRGGNVGISLAALNNWDVRKVTDFTHMFEFSGIDREGIIGTSNVSDIVFPNFVLRPGTWDNSIYQNSNDGNMNYYSGTYVPNN